MSTAKSTESTENTESIPPPPPSPKPEPEPAIMGLDGELDDDDLSFITLIANGDAKEEEEEGEIRFRIRKQYACTHSKLINTSLTNDAAATELPLKSVNATELRQIVEYMNHHKENVPKIVKKPLTGKTMLENVEDKWEAEFIDSFDILSLYELLSAASYMDINVLVHLGCAKIACMIKDKPLEEIEKILNGDIKIPK